MTIIHNTRSTDKPNNNIAICLAEIQANKDDAADYIETAYSYVRVGAYANAKHTYERALKCIERNIRWNERLRLYRLGMTHQQVNELIIDPDRVKEMAERGK